MESFLEFIGSATSSGFYTSLFDGMFTIKDTTMILVLGICLFGTTVVGNITNRTSTLEYVTTFSSLFIGALMANAVLLDVELPVASELAQSAVAANIGMTFAGLIILAIYGREGYMDK